MASDPFDMAVSRAQQQQQQQQHQYVAAPTAPEDEGKEEVGFSQPQQQQQQQRQQLQEQQERRSSKGAASHMPQFRQHALKTVNYCLLFCLVGMSDASIGAALPGLTCLARTSEQRATLLLFFHEIAVLLMTIFSGFLNRKVPANLVMTVVSVLVPACFVLVTFCGSLPSMAFIFGLMGLAEGCLEFFCNTQMIFLYRDSSGPFLQAMFFSQSVGALVSPLIIGSFMSKPLFRQWSNCSLPEELEAAMSAESIGDVIQRDPALGEMLSRVRYPFYAIAVTQIPIMLSMFYLSYKEGWTHEVTRSAEQEEEIEDRREEGSSAYLVLAFASACAFALDGLMGAFSSLIYTFSTHSVQSVVSEARAAYLPATFWGFTLIGRLIGIFLTVRLSSVHVIFLDLVGLIFSATLFMIGQKSVAVLFLSTMMTGFFISHCMPALLALTEQFIQVTRDRATSLVASAAFGEAVLPVLMAAVMNKIHPIAYPIFYSVFVLVAVVLCFCFVNLGYRTKKSQFSESRFDSFLRLGFFARFMPKKDEMMPMQSMQQQQQPQQAWQTDAGFLAAAQDGAFQQPQPQPQPHHQQSSFTVQQRHRPTYDDDSFDELANRHN